MKKIFILEDDGQRIGAFYDVLDKHQVTLRRDVPHAIKAFEPPYDLILLDRDLAPHHYASVRDEDVKEEEKIGTGEEFARWLAETQVSAKRTIIHSWNICAVPRMYKTLHDAGWIVDIQPFGRTLLEFLDQAYD